ncbi:MAG TPA: TetR/AcrR family transcriptional regulator [Steroidobacteraceae bacterium]|nr:TetR/AcrR family transcriptional regulator [Steroidobacteraceae bacterium]
MPRTNASSLTMKGAPPGLAGRHEPLQERSKESVDRILATTATLLDEVGIDGFNTNLLAERAGVRIRTVYRYFPNKYAVIVALTKRLAIQWDEMMGDYYRRMADPESEWREVIRSSNFQWLERARTVPGALSVLQAINATPELQQLHFQIFEDMSRKLASVFAARGVRQPPHKLLTIARTVTAATNSRTDVYLQLKGREAQEFWQEVSLSEERYLEPYLAEPVRRSNRPRKSGRGRRRGG